MPGYPQAGITSGKQFAAISRHAFSFLLLVNPVRTMSKFFRFELE